MKTVAPASLKTVPQDDVVVFVRLSRALVTNLRVYPEGHSIVKDVAARVGERVAKVGEDVGAILVGADTAMLNVNRDSIYKDCDEQKFSVELAAWLRERGVDNLLFEPGIEAEEILRLFGWLHRTQPREVRDILSVGLPAELASEHLGVNVRAPKEDAAIRQTLEAMDFTELLEKAGVTTASIPTLQDVDWDQVDLGKLAAQGKLDGLMDEDRMGRFIEDYLGSRLDPAILEARGEAALDPEKIDEILARLETDLQPLKSDEVQETIAAKAAEAVSRMLPDAVAAYLSTELPEATSARQARHDVLDSLERDQARQADVLKELSGKLATSRDVARGLACLHAMEEIIPRVVTIDGGAAADAVGAIALASMPGRPERLVQRAKMSLRYLASPEVVRGLLHRLGTVTPAEQVRTRDLLQVLGAYAVTTLIEELRSSMKKGTRLELVNLLTHVGQRAMMEGEDPAEVLGPLARELNRHNDNPWYFTRNVVVVLGSVGAPALQTRLTGLFLSDVDPRIRTEIARGLMRSDTDVARKLVRQAAFEGLLSDPPGLAEVIPYLLRNDPAGTLTSMEALLISKDVLPQLAEAVLVGLALKAGAVAVPLLAKVLTARSGLLKRPVFPEASRLAALEAASALDDAQARRALEAAQRDKSAAVRRRALERINSKPRKQAERLRERLRIE